MSGFPTNATLDTLFLFCFLRKKWVKEGNLSWRLPLGCDYSDTLLAGLGLQEQGV